ncbi:hypothetical protein D0Y65_011972 [Glycine soja]|uniref:RRM domain-containing protein n=1 Tax=Glycine soja TaxID=3848 RepID=A0A445KMQ8_GLYSO|nr:hypothetical protein D0Y65_011972 [Glycine soja]
MRRSARLGRRITSFFFSKFPDEYCEENLWKIFSKYGKVWGIFIAKRKDKWRNIYGFVRFIDVNNVAHLDKQLDQITIGNVKMNVNIPKFERPQVAFTIDEGGTSYRVTERESATLYEMEGDTGKTNHDHKERQLITQLFA